MATSALTQFKAVYSSGAFIPESSAVVALSLLFEKIHLPNNVEVVREFATKYRLTPSSAKDHSETIRMESDGGEDPFSDLNDEQQETVRRYLGWSMRFAHANSELFGEVFESELFPNNKIVDVKLVKKGGLGELNKYSVTFSNQLTLTGGDENYFPNLIERGYVPIVGRYHHASPLEWKPDEATTKQLAALLAMKSVQMVLPRTRSARPEFILEARYRLREQLPPFWSAMLKASVELKKLVASSSTYVEVSKEASDLVDRTILPAVIDLEAKLERERKDWFYKILSPVRSGLRLLVGNPPLTQQQLISSALVLASDTCVSIADNMRSIEALKREAGISYLLDLSALSENERREA